MDRDDLRDLIQQQILDSQAHFEAQKSRGERTDGVVDLLRSLRLTLRLLSSGMDPEDDVASSFVLSVPEEGRAVLQRDHHLAEVSDAFLRFLRHSGISLVPGEALLVEPELARRVIEDSLGEVFSEESLLERRRADLTGGLLALPDQARAGLLEALAALEEREAHLDVEKAELTELNRAVTQILSTGVTSGE